MKWKITILAFATLVSALSVGCKRNEIPGQKINLNVLVFVDQSDSISADQRRAWLKEAGKVLRRLRGGTHFYLYGIHDHTLEAAPKMITIPELPERPLAKQYQEWNSASQQAMAYLSEAMNTDSPSRMTDIFSAFDRTVMVAQGLPTKIVIFSDMLHVTPDMNMEKQPLHDKDFSETISKLGRKHDWSSDTLHNTAVFAVLPDEPKTSGSPVSKVANDRRVLQRFYATLIAALGGKLALFDTNLQSGGIQ